MENLRERSCVLIYVNSGHGQTRNVLSLESLVLRLLLLQLYIPSHRLVEKGSRARHQTRQLSRPSLLLLNRILSCNRRQRCLTIKWILPSRLLTRLLLHALCLLETILRPVEGRLLQVTIIVKAIVHGLTFGIRQIKETRVFIAQLVHKASRSLLASQLLFIEYFRQSNSLIIYLNTFKKQRTKSTIKINKNSPN